MIVVLILSLILVKWLEVKIIVSNNYPNTASTIGYNCNGIVRLYRHLFATSYKYVSLWQFTTDPIEKEFS